MTSYGHTPNGRDWNPIEGFFSYGPKSKFVAKPFFCPVSHHKGAVDLTRADSQKAMLSLVPGAVRGSEKVIHKPSSVNNFS